MTKLKNIVAAIVSLVIFTTATNAQVTAPVTASEPFTIQYLGSDGEYLLFTLTMQPTNASRGKFQISDSELGALYTSSLPKSYKVTTLKIEKKDGQELNFRVVSGKNVYSKSFSVNTNLVEKTIVSESDITLL